MSHRRKNMRGTASFGAIVVLLHFLTSSCFSAEPKLEGLPLSDWLIRNFYSNSMPHLEQIPMVQALGSNAVPTLMRFLKAKDSILLSNAVQILKKQDFVAVNYVPAEEKHWKSWLGFLALGERASNAVPELVQLYQSSGSVDLRSRVARVFFAIGPSAEPAIPLLLPDFRSTTNFEFRAAIVSALGSINRQPEAVVPALISALEEPDLQTSTADALSKFGSEARPAIPKLKEVLQNAGSRGKGFGERIKASLVAIGMDPKEADRLEPEYDLIFVE